MRLSKTPPPGLLSLLLVALSQIDNVNAGPFPKDSLHDIFNFGWLQPRDCVGYCGAQNQYCCTAGQACYTNAANVAYCSAGAQSAVGAGYGVYTTTWTETDLVTRTSTYSSYYQAATTTQSTWAVVATGAPAICTTSLGESSCGIICCASNQRCASAGSCTAYSSTYVATGTLSAPLRPTSGGVSTATSVVSATTTAPFIPPATASGSTLPITSHRSGGGLSGGAIAGIVIGTIAGVILLLLICFCCIVGTALDGLLGLFGIGKKRDRDRRTERVETVERYSRHSGAGGSRRETHGGWFGGGGRPARVVESRRTEKKSSGFGGLGMVGAGLLGLAAVLGLKRNHDRKEKSNAGRSDISSSYYTDSYTGTSASSASSDRRTRESRGTRTTRTTRR